MPRPDKLVNLLDRIRMCIEDGRFRVTAHALLRQRQRSMILTDILFVLTTGRHEKNHDKFDEAFRSWNYAVRGLTVNSDDIRVIVSFDEENFLLVITAFYIENRK